MRLIFATISDLPFEFLGAVYATFRMVRVEECCEADFVALRVVARRNDVPHLLRCRRDFWDCNIRNIAPVTRVIFPTSKGLAAELEASAYLVVGGTSIGVNIPSRARRVMFVSHAADVEARAAEGAVCELVTASLRSRWRMTIPRRLSNVSYHSETTGVFVTYLMVAHVGLVVRIVLLR